MIVCIYLHACKEPHHTCKNLYHACLCTIESVIFIARGINWCLSAAYQGLNALFCVNLFLGQRMSLSDIVSLPSQDKTSRDIRKPQHTDVGSMCKCVNDHLASREESRNELFFIAFKRIVMQTLRWRIKRRKTIFTRITTCLVAGMDIIDKAVIDSIKPVQDDPF
jgi:hypothetical protein